LEVQVRNREERTLAALRKKGIPLLRGRAVPKSFGKIGKGEKSAKAAVLKRNRTVIPRRRQKPSHLVPLSRYNSIFSSNTPPIDIDPKVWDVILKRLPPNYSIPDPVFQTFLGKNPR
jgi:hypothetical protein